MLQLEKIWPKWHVVEEIGNGSFGKVYKIRREDIGGEYFSALKVISIPKDRSEIADVMAEGMDIESASDYYNDMMTEIVREFVLMEKLKGNTNIVGYEDHEVIPGENGIGGDIYIRMELLTSLNTYMQTHKFCETDVIKLGIDLCQALVLCENRNIIHRDIKPENIFISEDGYYKLGDFGVARTADRTMSGMSIKGTVSCMAPEVYKGQAYNNTVDIYSLGIVMYRLLNDNRVPFMPPAPQKIFFSDRENAQTRRMSGEVFPKPSRASEGIYRIICKACNYNRNERYKSAADMIKDLTLLSSPEQDFSMSQSFNLIDETVSVYADTKADKSNAADHCMTHKWAEDAHQGRHSECNDYGKVQSYSAQNENNSARNTGISEEHQERSNNSIEQHKIIYIPDKPVYLKADESDNGLVYAKTHKKKTIDGTVLSFIIIGAMIAVITLIMCLVLK